MTRHALVLLPELAYLPGLVAPELERDRAREELRAHAHGRGWLFEGAEDGRDAAGIVDGLVAGGATAALVVGRPWDARAAELLAARCRERGLAVDRALDDGEVGAALGQAWSWPEREAPRPGVLALPAVPPVDLDAWLEAPERRVLSGGDAEVLLAPPRADAPDEGARARVAGSPWALALGWHEPAWPLAFAELVDRVAPRHRLCVDVVLGYLAQAVAPLEEAWGDGGLADHNAELLVNVVSAPEEPRT